MRMITEHTIDYGGGYNIYYNTVHLNTSQSVNGFLACINITSFVTTAASVNIKNNIFSNVQTNECQRYAIESQKQQVVFLVRSITMIIIL